VCITWSRICRNDACRHQAVIEVLGDPDDFQRLFYFFFMLLNTSRPI
jgi:hypothetical protein